MATRPTSPAKPVARVATPAPKPVDPYSPVDALPLPEVIEKDTDSVWALWTDAVKETPERGTDTQPSTLLMDLPETPSDEDG